LPPKQKWVERDRRHKTERAYSILSNAVTKEKKKVGHYYVTTGDIGGDNQTNDPTPWLSLINGELRFNIMRGKMQVPTKRRREKDTKARHRFHVTI